MDIFIFLFGLAICVTLFYAVIYPEIRLYRWIRTQAYKNFERIEFVENFHFTRKPTLKDIVEDNAPIIAYYDVILHLDDNLYMSWMIYEDGSIRDVLRLGDKDDGSPDEWKIRYIAVREKCENFDSADKLHALDSKIKHVFSLNKRMRRLLQDISAEQFVLYKLSK